MHDTVRFRRVVSVKTNNKHYLTISTCAGRNLIPLLMYAKWYSQFFIGPAGIQFKIWWSSSYSCYFYFNGTSRQMSESAHPWEELLECQIILVNLVSHKQVVINKRWHPLCLCRSFMTFYQLNFKHHIQMRVSLKIKMRKWGEEYKIFLHEAHYFFLRRSAEI